MEKSEWLVQLVGKESIPLFLLDGFGVLETKVSNGKTLIRRHYDMERNIISECAIIRQSIKDETDEYEGIFTMVYFWESFQVKPYFLTATEAYGKDGFTLNKNLSDTKSTNTSKQFFARWGDDYERHIGQLSNALFPSNGVPFPKAKEQWIKDFFKPVKGGYFALKQGVWFIAKAWARDALAWDSKHYYLTDLTKMIKGSD